MPTAKTENVIDLNGNILNVISSIYGDELKDKLPLVLFCDATGNVYLFSSGYKIGVGEQLLKVILLLNRTGKWER